MADSQGVNFENISNATINVGGHVVGGDLTIQYLTQGLSRLPTDYSGSIRNFLQEYLGSETRRVPFGGRGESLLALEEWLDDPAAPPYALLVAEAGRGKSALLARWLHWLRERGKYHLVFVPVSIRFNTALESVVFTALAARLGEVYGEPVEWANLPAAAWRGVCQTFLGRTPPDGKPVLVILDGLDEAADWQAGADLFPLDPPPGVRVIVSARRLAHCDEAGWRQRLNWTGDDRARAIPLPLLNEAGLRDVLRQMGNPLDALMTKVDVVRELHRLSEGDPLLVRLYVEALVAQSERVASLAPEELAAIPPGLGGYLDRWWSEQRQVWGKDSPTREPGVRALLNLLAAALGPLEKEPLLALAPPEAGLDAWTLDDALAPLGRFIVGDGVAQGYVFSHPRLGYHFWEKLTPRERTQWEACFLCWGEETLQGLNDGTLAPKDAPRYIVQHYGAHLERAKAPDEALYALVSEGWMRAWEWLEGTHAGFLTDVERAWKRAADENAFLATQQGRGRRLAMQVKCALCQSSVAALSANIPPELLALAIESGQYSPVQALVIAQQMLDEAQRSKALVAIVRLLPPELRGSAATIASTIGNVERRAWALCRLTAYQTGEQQAETAQQALQAARAVGDERSRADALTGLAPHITESQLQEALAAARAIVDERWRVAALMGLVLHLSGSYQAAVIAETLATVRASGSEGRWVPALTGLAPHLTEGRLQEVLVAACGIADEASRAAALTDLAPYLSARQLDEALAAARAIEHKVWWTAALAGLAPHLVQGQQTAVIAEALAMECAIRVQGLGTDALTRLAPYLSARQLDEALAGTRAGWDELWRATVLTDLAPHLSERQLDEALAAARAIRSEANRATALRGLAPHLSQSQQAAVIAEALAAARAIAHKETRIATLGALVPHLLQNQQAPVIVEALAAARTIGDEWRWAATLKCLAPHLSARQLDQALAIACAMEAEVWRAEALRCLAPHLSERQLDEALAAARALEDDERRALALTGLAPYLSQAQQTAIITEALAAACTIGEEWRRAPAITRLLPYLSEPQVQEALVAARAMKWEESRAETLTGLAPYLSEAQQVTVIAEAFAAARAIKYKQKRAEILTGLAPHLSEGQVQEALAAVRAVWDDGDRAFTLTNLAPHLSQEQQAGTIAEALEAARAIRDEKELRANILGDLEPHLSGWAVFETKGAVSTWWATLPVLASRPRPAFLNDLAALMPFALALAGDEAPQAAQGIFEAIQEVCAWWP